MIVIMAETSTDSETNRLIEAASRGNQSAWFEILDRHRERLRRMVVLRMDRRLQGRVDASDIIQDACVDAIQRLPDYLDKPTMPLFLWLRFLVGQRLVDEHRRHLGAKAREVGREVTLFHGTIPEATSAVLAAQLLGRLTSPSHAAIRAEQQIQLQEALNSLEPIDREILALRHFEQLSNGEAAAVLGLDKSAASKRYARALIRLKEMLAQMPVAWRSSEHGRDEHRSRPDRGDGRLVPGPLPRRRAAERGGVRRQVPRAGRRDPRAAAGTGQAGAELRRQGGEGRGLRGGRPSSPARQLGEYLLLREIGRGGMGVVYEAVQQSLGRHVALKVLAGGELSGSSHLERFRREARAAARLHHTNIVPVFGVGEQGGVHYYAMQFIQGQGLDAIFDERIRRLRLQVADHAAVAVPPANGDRVNADDTRRGAAGPAVTRIIYHKSPSDNYLRISRSPSVMDDDAFSAAVLSKLPLADAVWRIASTRPGRLLAGRPLGDVIAAAATSKSSSSARWLGWLPRPWSSTAAAATRPSSGGRRPADCRSPRARPTRSSGTCPLPLSEAMLEEGTRRMYASCCPRPRLSVPAAGVLGGPRALRRRRQGDQARQAAVEAAARPAGGHPRCAGVGGVEPADRHGGGDGRAPRRRGRRGGTDREPCCRSCAAAAGDRIWVMVLDRLYCNLGFPPLVLTAGGHFLIRYNSNTDFVADPGRPALEGRDAAGQRIVQEWGRLGKGGRPTGGTGTADHSAPGRGQGDQRSHGPDGRGRVSGRGRCCRPTTSRWGIERVFHQITDVFSLRNLIGTTPPAVLFQLSFCLLLYNSLQVVACPSGVAPAMRGRRRSPTRSCSTT